MNLSRLFILRPVATSLLMVATLIAGALAYRWLPIAALPQVDYPTIQVQTFMPGASPEVIATAITAPLERQLGRHQQQRQIPGRRWKSLRQKLKLKYQENQENQKLLRQLLRRQMAVVVLQ